jgi:peptidoglycan/LPS O-acetylase OafA/YrhL
VPVSDPAGKAARVERLFRIALVPLVLFLAASLYVRFTGDRDPLWTEFAMPVFFTALGVRALALPATPESGKSQRGVGILLIVCAALILLLHLLDHFQGSN